MDFYSRAMQDPLLLELLQPIGIILAAILAAYGVWKGIKQKNDEIVIRHITDKRVDWINDVRNTIAEFISDVTILHNHFDTICDKNLQKTYITEEDTNKNEKAREEAVERAYELRNMLNYNTQKLYLYLNFKGNWDREIGRTISQIVLHMSGKLFSDNLYEEQIEIYNQMKKEYIKLKDEHDKEDEELQKKIYKAKTCLYILTN